MTNRLEDLALIGDCESAALVGRDGSVDWLCWPRFDSGAVFAALLGDRKNGRWLLSPSEDVLAVRRRYRDNTLVLETEFETTSGVAVVIDFMPLRANSSSHLVRIVRGRRGRVPMMTELLLRFGYGSIVPWIVRVDDETLRAIAGPDQVQLRTRVPIEPDGYRHRGEFVIEAGESVCFDLGYSPSFGAKPEAIDAEAALAETERLWQSWNARVEAPSAFAPAVSRSLITLKALTYRRTGGIIAAPTTSLPEQVGSTRNWDYRYCWLRDATFTLLALLNSGFTAEAESWRAWLHHAVAGDPSQVQIMYGLSGERRLDEWEVPWLAGYEGSKPVRVGNAAAGQLQLDIFGEVMDALYQSAHAGLGVPGADWDLQHALVEHLATVWHEPDEGLWEVRSGRRHFTHSKVMAWVALDRAVKTIQKFGVNGPVERWCELRDRIHRQVCAEGYNESIGSFTQSYGSSALDASALLIPLVGFLPPCDPRIVSTVKAVEKNLLVDGFIRRYRTDDTNDGLPGGEGAFLACSFWYADNLVMLGRQTEARELFERLLDLRNDVGLLSEEYDPTSRRMLGNFPQAFSHVAIINTAHNLVKHAKPAEQRSGNTPEAPGSGK